MTYLMNKIKSFGFHLISKLKGHFFIYLAILCSLFAAVDLTVGHFIGTMESRTFDTIMKNRVFYQPADSDIIVVDIDEGSLSALSEEYGRWPWPRQVFAEFTESLMEQEPKAIVFDVLFSDADIQNPESDEYFDDVIGATDNSFFPMVRLNSDNDKLSQITPAMIPGMSPIKDKTATSPPISVVLPFFNSIIQSGRMGTNNIYPDEDGKVRKYPLFETHGSWQIPSLPAKVAQSLGWSLPENHDRIILNWRGKPGAFQHVRFSEVYNDFLSRNKKRPSDEFKDKIIIIGSTAPGLFDSKATPMDKTHPGVEILATAIDNLKHGDWIIQPEFPWYHLIIALLFIWITAFGFLKNFNVYLMNTGFALTQVVLVGFSYMSLNLSNHYVDLTVPVTVGFFYFLLGRVYKMAEAFLADQYVWIPRPKAESELWQSAVVFALQLNEEQLSSERKKTGKFKWHLKSIHPTYSVEEFPDKPIGIQRGLSDVVLIYYLGDIVDQKSLASQSELEQRIVEVKQAAKTIYQFDQLQLGVASGGIPVDNETHKNQVWKQLVTTALYHLHHKGHGSQ
jgi:adenylate cyclase